MYRLPVTINYLTVRVCIPPYPERTDHLTIYGNKTIPEILKDLDQAYYGVPYHLCGKQTKTIVYQIEDDMIVRYGKEVL